MGSDSEGWRAISLSSVVVLLFSTYAWYSSGEDPELKVAPTDRHTARSCIAKTKRIIVQRCILEVLVDARKMSVTMRCYSEVKGKPKVRKMSNRTR